MLPMVVDVRFGQRAFEQRQFEAFGPHRQRDAHFAGEAGVVARTGVEAGVREAGGRCGEADIGGGAERREEALFGVAVDGAGLGDAQLQPAFRADDACRPFRLLGLGEAGGGEGQRRFPALGEVGVGVASLGEHRAVEAGHARGVAGVAAAFEFGQERGVLQRLFAGIGAWGGGWHAPIGSGEILHCKGGRFALSARLPKRQFWKPWREAGPTGPRRTDR